MEEKKKFSLTEFVHKPIVEKVLFVIASIIAVYTATRTILNLCYVSESLYQTIRDGFFWKAMVYFMVFILVVNKTRLINFITAIFSVLSATGIILALQRFKESPDLLNIYKHQYITFALCGVLLIDLILYKKIVLLKGRTLWFSILYLVCMLPAFILKKGAYATIVPLIPMLFIFLISMKEVQWIRTCYYFSIGFYLAFFYTMIKSFLTVPYTGERYYGIFINMGLFGMFAGGAFCCALYWMVMEFQREKKRIPVIVISAIALIFATVCTDMISARVAMVGIFITLIVMFILTSKKKNQMIKRLGIVLGIIGIGAIVLIALIVLFKGKTYDDIKAVMPNHFLAEKVNYICINVNRLFVEESRMGILPGGTIWNTLDWISNSRISYWYTYWKGMNLWGHESLGIDTPVRFMMHPHNTYIAWLYQFGIIPGAFYVISFIAALVVSSVRVIKKDKTCIFSCIWLVYCFLIYMNEVEQWTYQVGFAVLFALFPIIMNNQVRNKEEQTLPKEENS